jgi:hypothetical protein
MRAAAFAICVLAGCAEDNTESPWLKPPSESQQCRRAIDYETSAYAFGDVTAKISLDAQYRITAIDALALNTPALRQAGDEMLVNDGMQYNLCQMINLTANDPAKHEGFEQRMLVDQRRVSCIMTKVRTLGARIRSGDVESCLSKP